jgi:hypothetical protein
MSYIDFKDSIKAFIVASAMGACFTEVIAYAACVGAKGEDLLAGAIRVSFAAADELRKPSCSFLVEIASYCVACCQSSYFYEHRRVFFQWNPFHAFSFCFCFYRLIFCVLNLSIFRH